jgi:hypothetical protein
MPCYFHAVPYIVPCRTECPAGWRRAVLLPCHAVQSAPCFAGLRRAMLLPCCAVHSGLPACASRAIAVPRCAMSCHAGLHCAVLLPCRASSATQACTVPCYCRGDMHTSSALPILVVPLVVPYAVVSLYYYIAANFCTGREINLVHVIRIHYFECPCTYHTAADLRNIHALNLRRGVLLPCHTEPCQFAPRCAMAVPCHS